jgi:hypothetical protein
MSEYTVKYNRTTNHIAGIAERTKGSDFNYAVSACPVLSRSYNLANGKAYGSLAEALENARKGGRKLCKKCEAAAVAALEALEGEAAPEVQEDAPEVVEAPQGPKETGPVPANFLELAKRGNTPQARAYWQRRCDNWG